MCQSGWAHSPTLFDGDVIERPRFNSITNLDIFCVLMMLQFSLYSDKIDLLIDHSLYVLNEWLEYLSDMVAVHNQLNLRWQQQISDTYVFIAQQLERRLFAASSGKLAIGKFT